MRATPWHVVSLKPKPKFGEPGWRPPCDCFRCHNHFTSKISDEETSDKQGNEVAE